MDYDDNDFQSQNLHLAGEGSNKFPPVLRPYALPKFDFDDNLHGPLRFDSLVETEVFLGIETNEDNQWIEDYTRGSGEIQFNSSVAESCSISRRDNVWSEATSSESVEMLLKSVGQEEIIPVQTNTKVSDACDELVCIIKQMEPSLKRGNNRPAKAEDVTDLQPKLSPNKIPENLSVLDIDFGAQQFLAEDSSQTHKDDVSVDGGLGNLTTISEKVRLHSSEESPFIGGKSNNQIEAETMVGTSLDNRTQGSVSGMQTDITVASMQNIIGGNDKFINEDAPDHVNENADDNRGALEMSNDVTQKDQPVLSQDAKMDDQILDTNMVESGTSHLENPICLASTESMEVRNMVETNSLNVEEPSCAITKVDSCLSEDLKIGDQSRVNTQEVSLMGMEGSTALKGHEFVDDSGSRLDKKNLVSKSGASLSSFEDEKASKDKVDECSIIHVGDNSTLTIECSSVEFLSEKHAEGHVSSSIPAESQMSEPEENNIHKFDQDVPVEEQERKEFPSNSSSVEHEVCGTENKLAVSNLHLDAAASNESVHGESLPSLDDNTTDGVTHHKDVDMSYLPAIGFTHSDKDGEIAYKISIESSSPNAMISGQLTASLDPISVSENGASGAASQTVCDSVDQSLLMVSACNTESQLEPQVVVASKVNQEHTKEEVSPALCDSNANEGDGAEALAQGNDKTVSPKSSELTLKNNEILEPVPSSQEESHWNTSQKGQVKNEGFTASEDKSDGQIVVPGTNECGRSCANADKPASGSAIVIGTIEFSRNGVDKEGVKGSSDHSISASEIADGDANRAQSVLRDPKQNNASRNEETFTCEVSSPSDLPQKEADRKQQYSAIQASKVSPVVDRSPPTPGLGQLDPKIAQDPSRGSPKLSDVAIVPSGSKGTTERKTRRASGKGTVKETAKKGTPVKETAPVRLERGDKLSNISPGSSGISQLVQSNEIQRYVHVDSSNIKPFVLAASTSSLPDLNSAASSSAVFQQPFTDLQQVQLRAQIFVYGALIQGTAPDEAYMISAFGGPDGGRSIWENAWRLCIERLHSQKSHLITPETPLQSRSGTRGPDQAIKPSALQSKAMSPSVGRPSSKATPSTIVNPIVPLSSPLWTLSTPSSDALQSSGIPRVPVMDYQRAFSPLHPHQTPPMRNFVGPSPFSFGGPWVPSSQTSTLDASSRFPVQPPVNEPVQLTSVKESSVPHSSGTRHVVSGPVAQSGALSSVFAGTSVPIVEKATTASGQPSTDSKPRKRKKTSASENLGQNIVHSQPQAESAPTSTVSSHVSASVGITTPVGFVSKASTKKFITPVSPASSTDIRKGNQNETCPAFLSVETLAKVKEARVQAEDAAALASAAVSHSLEIWNQLDEQRKSGLLPDVETKLASAAVAVAAAAAVAKAAAAAADVASNAAFQAKLMAEEAVLPGGHRNLSQSNAISLSGGKKILGNATPASILKGDDGTNDSSSILCAAREAVLRTVEATTFASTRAQNMDAIIKAAELAAKAVSQVGKIASMGDVLSLSELVATGLEGCWEVPRVTSDIFSKSGDIGRENMNVDSYGGGPDSSARHLKEGLSGKKEMPYEDNRQSPTPTEPISERLADGFSDKDAKGQKGRGDLAKATGVVSEAKNDSRVSVTAQDEYGKAPETLKENGIKEGSLVEVFKDGAGFKAAWFSANVLTLKDEKAYVSYTELTSGEGTGKLQEWVALKNEGDRPPKIRIARPMIAMPFEGTRKRRRAAMGDYSWSVGDRVDAWIQDSWHEGVIADKSKTDETMLTVQFPVQGETSVVRAWHLRPSLIWKDGEWIEWSGSGDNNCSSHGGDTPQEKRPRVRSPAVEVKGKDKTSKIIDAMGSDKPDDPTLLDIAVHEKLFNIGKSTMDEKKPDLLRMTRTGSQKEGSRVIFGVPKPGKKRKFMEVSKHYVADQSSKIVEANDSVKFAKYLMPQGSGSRGWKNNSKTESNEKRAGISKPRVLKSGKAQNLSGRTIPPKDNSLSATTSTHGDAAMIHIAKTRDSASRENTLKEQNVMNFQPSASSEGAAEGPILFSSLAHASDTLPSKKSSVTTVKSERANKGKLAPACGKLGKIEDKVFNSVAKSLSDVRRSNRRIQPTSRLLEGLQSSLMVSKIPSVSHDKSHKSRSAARG